MSLGAAFVAAVALVVSVLDETPEGQAFFGVALPAALLQAWALRGAGDARRRLAWLVALVWDGAAVWISGLLIWYQAAASRPPPSPEATYLGFTATAYHITALWLGAVLVTAAVLVAQAHARTRHTAADRVRPPGV